MNRLKFIKTAGKLPIILERSEDYTPILVKENWRMSTWCNQLDLQTRGSQPISMPKNLPNRSLIASFAESGAHGVRLGFRKLRFAGVSKFRGFEYQIFNHAFMKWDLILVVAIESIRKFGERSQKNATLSYRFDARHEEAPKTVQLLGYHIMSHGA